MAVAVARTARPERVLISRLLLFEGNPDDPDDADDHPGFSG